MTITTGANEIDRRLLMDRSMAGRKAFTVPISDVPDQDLPNDELLRDDLELPEVSQLEVIRYFSVLSQRNFSIDTNFYPLGSCTMKYNPKINDELASLPGLADIHPLQPDETVQGALRLLKDLQDCLGEITALPGVSLAPLAGAQGEYAGLLVARAYHDSRGDSARTVAIVPDSAHGTNPASAAMAGLDVVTVRSNEHGNIDVQNLRELANENTAVFMLTIPSTLGLFEPNILEITKIIHDAGGLVYADGANLNALLGLVKLGDLGVDICHSNLHKTFSTPHGGGGPGSGPVMVAEELSEFLPKPVAELTDDGYVLATPKNSIGSINGFHGSFSIAARAYAYIKALGIEGLQSVSENAIIGANYIQAKLKDKYNLAADRYCMHETVLSATRQKKRGVGGLDIAKRLLDFGIHAPTMYFPLIVDEALMIEPTESESKETLDHFIAVMRQIDDEIDSSPELIHEAPHDLPVTRLDEATAARKPILRWSADE
ncbi:MAG: glycine dehydrogenase (aminomethyl-transferring) [Chloroflexi bacterium]|nr:glycine dehydrogenase (aminomethyl-transferring) [Chloroflexota bacterium]|tara:strand:- start:30549 stop:32015 length:1467 start_codon:yes stop_codon:yes gene_type:complete